MDWIVNRIKEVSSHNGVIVAAGAATVLFLGLSITEVVLWGALAWGVWSILRSD